MTRFELECRLEKAEGLLELGRAYGWDTSKQEVHCESLRVQLAATPVDDSIMGRMLEIGRMARAV